MQIHPMQKVIFDWQETLRLANGKLDLAKEILKLFYQELPQAKLAINQAYQIQDWQQTNMLLHKLYGSCCYCVSPRLKNIIRRLELAIKDNDKLEPDLIELFNQAADDLEQEISSMQAEVSPA